MSLKITNVTNSNKPEEEYVRLTVEGDCNLHNYMIIDNTFRMGELSNIHRHFYRFPSQLVKKGDVIRLYTGEGSNIIKESTNGNKIYHYYMNSENCIWNDSGDEISLYYIRYQQSKKIE